MGHELRAPSGLFRLIGVDMFDPPGADFLIGDFSNLRDAIAEAVKRARDLTRYYVYSDQGAIVFEG